MNNPNLTEVSQETQWQKGQSGNPAGRPPDKIKKFLKSCNVTKADIDAIYDNLLWDYTTEQLKALLKSGIGKSAEVPEYLKLFVNEHGELAAGIQAIISGIIHDVSRGDIKVTNLMLDRRHGKAKESVSLSGNMNIVANLPIEERDKQLNDLLEKMNGHKQAE